MPRGAATRGCFDQGRGEVEPACDNPVCVSVALLYPILCDPIDCSPPGSSVHGIFQARILERFLFSTSGDLPDPGIKPSSPVSPTLAGRFFTTEPLGKPN